MKKFAWTWTVKPEYVDKYVRLNKNPKPEVMEALSKGGIKNYSIFQNGNQFFYVYECEDKPDWEYIDSIEACKQWIAATAQMVESGFDSAHRKPITYLEEVFYLK